MSNCPITKESLVNTTVACIHHLVDASIYSDEGDFVQQFLSEADMEYKNGKEEGSAHDLQVIEDFVVRDIYEIVRLGVEAYNYNANKNKK